MTTRNMAVLAFLATLAVAGLYFFSFPLIPVGDTYIMRGSHLIPESGTWQYWYSVFSHPNHGPQYRPVSFFTYFWIMGKLFNASLWSLAFVTYGLFAWAAFELGLLMKRLGWGVWAYVLGLLIWVLHPVGSNLLDQSFAIKYQFTFVVLIHGLRLFREESVPAWRWVVLALMALVVGLSQEGTIVYPFVWALWDWAWHRRLRKQHVIFFGYVALYLLCRTLFFHVPREGFMEVSLKHIPVGLSYYLHVVFAPLIGSYRWGMHYQGVWQNAWLVSSLIGLAIGVWAWRKGEWLPLFCGVVAAALTSPYSILINHIGHDRAFAGLLPAALLAGWCVQKWQRFRWVPTVVIGAALFSSFLSQRPEVKRYVTSMEQLQEKVREFLAEMNPQPDELVEVTFTSPNKEDEWLNFMLFAGEVAYQNPKAHMLFMLKDNRQPSFPYLHYVRAGVKYGSFGYRPNDTSIYGMDQFQVLHQFEFRPKSVRSSERNVILPQTKASEWVQQ